MFHRNTLLANLVRSLRKSRRGSILVMFAIGLSALAGATAVSLDLSKMYLARERNQAVTDLAVLAAIDTPGAIVGKYPSPLANATARSVATLNGYDAERMKLLVDASPINSTLPALRATLGEDVTMPVGWLSAGPTAEVNVTSWAETNTSGGCFRSLGGPTNIYNNAIVTAPHCMAEAKTYLYSCGNSRTTLAAASVGYTARAERPYLCSSASITPDGSGFTYAAKVVDTMATSPAVVAMRTRLEGMGRGWPFGTRSPVNPSVQNSNNNVRYVNANVVVRARERFGSMDVTNSNLTFTGGGAPDPNCQNVVSISGDLTLRGVNLLTFGSGCYVFGAAVTVTDGSNNQLRVAAGARVTFVFKGSLNNAKGAALSFGDSDLYFNGGTITNNGRKLNFGTGAFNLWGGSITNARGALLSAGNGPFLFYGGTIANYGEMVLGNGPFYFQGGSLAMNNASRTIFGIGDMLFYGGSVAAGGEFVTFGAGGSPVTGAGAVLMHGGTFALTSNTLNAVGVSFGFKGGSLGMTGIGTINATAPTAAQPVLGYRNLLFALWGGAFSLYQRDARVDTMSGMIYVPYSNASIYGSQTIVLPDGGCFGAVSYVLDIYQRARINAEPCDGFAGADIARGTLVQ